ncbi:hypothetical protein [Ascidiaceihabitans sp.]|uniref:hypothetical protein n=1 Tax=Ascidiaceihabitans sp. TaxID=1872644 RepID=UPI003297C6D6
MSELGVYGQVAGLGSAIGLNTSEGLALSVFAEGALGISGSAWGTVYIDPRDFDIFDNDPVDGVVDFAGNVYLGGGTPIGTPGIVFQVQKNVFSGATFITVGVGMEGVGEVGLYTEIQIPSYYADPVVIRHSGALETDGIVLVETSQRVGDKLIVSTHIEDSDGNKLPITQSAEYLNWTPGVSQVSPDGTVRDVYEFNGTEPVQTENCFVGCTSIETWTGISKPIEHIRPGDIVTSYDANGNLVPAKVTRTFVNEATHILDFFSTGVTPGHVFFCGEGHFKDQHVTLLDILRSDGGVVDASGKIIRACTGDEVGSDNDTTFVWAITGTPQPDGTVTIADRKQLRLSTRVITKDGRDLSLADIIFAMNATVTDTGMIRPNGSDTEVPLHWTFSPNLPAPEDYVLQRSGVTLEDIFAANEWEQRPKLPAPTRGEAGPSFVKSVEDVKGMFR